MDTNKETRVGGGMCFCLLALWAVLIFEAREARAQQRGIVVGPVEQREAIELDAADTTETTDEMTDETDETTDDTTETTDETTDGGMTLIECFLDGESIPCCRDRAGAPVDCCADMYGEPTPCCDLDGERVPCCPSPWVPCAFF